MAEESKKSRNPIPLYIVIVVIYTIIALQDGGKGGDFILIESVSHESDFEVNLTDDVDYKLWIESLNGPERVSVTISKDSYIAFHTFILTQSGGSYLPYHPKFTVKENGIYHVHAKPVDSGTVNLAIQRSIIPEFS